MNSMNTVRRYLPNCLSPIHLALLAAIAFVPVFQPQARAAQVPASTENSLQKLQDLTDFNRYIAHTKFLDRFGQNLLQELDLQAISSLSGKLDYLGNYFETEYQQAAIQWSYDDAKVSWTNLVTYGSMMWGSLFLYIGPDAFKQIWNAWGGKGSAFETLEKMWKLSTTLRNPFVIVYVSGAVTISTGLMVRALYTANKVARYQTKYENIEIQSKTLMKSYAKKRPFMIPTQQAYIDELFYQCNRTQEAVNLDQLKKILDIALRMPIERKDISYNHEYILELFHYFPKEIQDKMTQFVFTQVRNQKLHESKDTIADSYYPLYLVGKPGTGKTFSSALIAKGLNVPLAKVNLDGASIDDIVGLGFQTTAAKPGRLLEAITANAPGIDDISYSNQILLIDEFDRLLLNKDPQSQATLSYMLKLLDPDTRSFYSPYLNTKVQLPDTIILAGNFDISSFQEEEFEAINSRIEVLKFTGFERDMKTQMTWDFLVPTILDRYFAIKNPRYKFSGLNDEDKATIQRFIDQDKDPGVRSLGLVSK